MFNEINDTIKNKLINLTDDSGNTIFEEVYDYEATQFSGGPVATLSFSDNENDYATTESNERVYALDVRVYVSRDEPRTDEEAERIMRTILDDVIDKFDSDYLLNSLSEPTGKTLINTLAVPSRWGYSPRESQYRVGEVSVRCRVRVDINSI